MTNRNVMATLRNIPTLGNLGNLTITPAFGSVYTVGLDPMSEWVPQVGDAVTIEDNGQVRPPTIDAGPDSATFTIVQTISDNVVQITPADPPLNLDLNPVFESVEWPVAKPVAEDEVDLTNEELDLIAYALDNIDESIVATTFGLSPEEADEFLNQVYKKIKD